MSLLRPLLLKASTHPGLANRIPRLRFVQRAARRFMPGEEAEDALREADALRQREVPSLVTLLGENVEDQETAANVVGAYEDLLQRVRDRGLDTELSVKLTQLGLDVGEGADVGEEMARGNLERLVRAAAGGGSGGETDPVVWIDMEDSPRVESTLRIFRSLRERYVNVGICLQAYLHRSPGDLQDLLPLTPAVRLVKGAYREPPEVALPRKRDVDARYLELAEQLLRARGQGDVGRVGIATHDSRLIREIGRRAKAMGLERDGWEYEMLYGIGRGEQRRIVQEGARLRVLISYGSHWFPWYMRRLAERPANLGFVARKMIGL